MPNVQFSPADGKIYHISMNGREDITGKALWAVALWVEAHNTGEPYEIFYHDGSGGYRLTVEKLPARAVP